MKCPHSRALFGWLPAVLLLASSVASAQLPQLVPNPAFKWQVVVNNGVVVPGDTRLFNSYNQPSVNVNRMVVFRGRSKGGTTGEPAHGVFYRNMARGADLKTLFDRNTLVPQPNDVSSTFTEPPAFPRIDMWSNTIASRGSHQPAWDYLLPDGTETRAGTTGIYTNPFGDLIAGASNLGVVPDFGFFAAPGSGGVKFDVFPGAPAVADRRTLVFKGNYTVVENGLSVGKTGVYYRKLKDAPIGSGNLSPAGGTSPAILIANSDTVIPGSKGQVKFGSTAPPSAVGPFAVFAGFDNEDNPTMGGIYGTLLTGPVPKLLPLVKIGAKVPGEATGALFNKLSEGLSYDGRFVGFWGAWGTDTKELILQCPTDGNKDIIAYCQELYGDGINPGTISAGFHATVPVHQGIFIYDTVTGLTRSVAKTPNDFTDFVYWNFSGKAPSSGGSSEGGGSEGGDDGEPARWRSAEFVAVSGLVDGNLLNNNYDVAFKARTAELVNGSYANPIDGIYVRKGPDALQPFATVVVTGMDGTLVDPAATYIPVDESGNPIPGATPLPLPVTAMGVERDGFRSNVLAITVSMANDVAGWAGVYLTTVPAKY